MSLVPVQYSWIVSILLLFVDGLIFGLAAKKGILSAVLIVIGLVLAGAIGISIPFLTIGDVTTHIVNIFISQASHIGAVFYSFPVFWIIGFGIGLWKG
jgi:hypothetical protein